MKQNKPQIIESVEETSEAAASAFIVVGMFLFFTLVGAFVIFANSWN